MKFLRQFAAATAVVAAVVLAGLAWNRLAPTLPGEGPGGHAFIARGRAIKVLPPGAQPPPGGRPAPPGGRPPPPGMRGDNGSGIPGLLLSDLLKPVNLAVLRDTALLEAAVITAVVILDAGYRRLRRARRATTIRREPGISDSR